MFVRSVLCLFEYYGPFLEISCTSRKVLVESMHTSFNCISAIHDQGVCRLRRTETLHPSDTTLRRVPAARA